MRLASGASHDGGAPSTGADSEDGAGSKRGFGLLDRLPAVAEGELDPRDR
jgi:hypothetical protein